MQQVGYINNAGKNIKVEFTLMQNRIAPKNAQDAEILISAWDINDEILEAFLDFVNAEFKDDKARIALLTNTQKYQFFDSEEIYNAVALKDGLGATQERIENNIDEILENAIFNFDELILCEKRFLKSPKNQAPKNEARSDV